MTCHYPNCHQEAAWTPVIKLPTIRSVGDSKAMVETSRPTILLLKEVCKAHRDNYRLLDWLGTGDWSALQDVAHEHGYFIPEPQLIAVLFYPIGWTPRQGFELER